MRQATERTVHPTAFDRVRIERLTLEVDPPEEQGLTSLTLYFDVENWLQTGSVLRRADGELIAYYWFRDVEVNPHFAADQFKPAVLSR